MTGGTGVPVTMAGVHHRAVDAAGLEAVRRSVADGSPAAALALGAAGAVGVVTCHRAELYLEGLGEAAARSAFGAWCGGRPPCEPVVLTGAAAARHLLRVAAGLEAVALGDDQVLGQLRAAYAAACRGLAASPALHRLFHAAFRTGKRVRAGTALGRGGRSAAGEAVGVLARRLGGLAGRTVLVLGSGEMGRIAAARLRRRGLGQLLVTSRSARRAAELAAAAGGVAVPWAWRAEAACAADALIVATAAPEPVLGRGALARAAAGRLRIAVDLSMPRNLPDGDVPGLERIDLHRLGELLAADHERRLAAVREAEAIVEEELERWLRWLAGRPVRTPGRRPAREAAVG